MSLFNTFGLEQLIPQLEEDIDEQTVRLQVLYRGINQLTIP